MLVHEVFNIIFITILANLFAKLLANGRLEDKGLNFIVMPRYDVDLERLFV